MATLSINNPTLLDVAKASDPDGRVGVVAEILNATNEVLDDMTWQEGNLTTGHRTSIRAGLPAPTWRKLYGGVQPTKSRYVQVTESTAMLEAYAEIDKKLADLNGNTASFRLLEDKGHIEGMSQEMATALFFANEAVTPEKFTGFAPRFNSLSAANAENIIDGGGVGSDNTSIWLVVWGPDKVFGIYPKGLPAGLQVEDKGQVTIENADGVGGRMEGYRTHYSWDCGLVVRDWRYVVRIANIDKSALTADASAGADIFDLMVRAIELLPNRDGRPVFYMNRSLSTMARRQAINKVLGSTLTMDELGGRKFTSFDGIPIKRVDALAGDEARVT
jgi:hypothetical protein